MYCEKLTKKQLEEWGFTQLNYLPDMGITNEDPKKDWYVERYWRNRKSKHSITKRVSITEAICKHKYSEDKKYWKITFSYNKKVKTITFARFVYVWFIGDLEEGEVVDHIDNNSFNNHPSNLQKLSVGENLAKKNMDNPKYARNQYEVNCKQLFTKLYDHEITVDEGIKLFKEFYQIKHSEIFEDLLDVQ